MTATGRRIFVGDIQGCLVQLDALLGAVAFEPSIDVLYPVGDLVNKGPDSIGVLRRCIELDAQPVLGNHDRSLLRRGRLRDDTVPDKELVEWLAGQPIVRVFDDIILVHAGLHPQWSEGDLEGLDEEGASFATTVRYVAEDGSRPPKDWPPPGPPYRPWYELYRGDKRIVFGHWARRGLVVRPRCVGLDSGCVYGGELSAWIAEEDRIVQVPGLVT